jgi:putative peptide-modifying radical SAM enzyme
MQFVLCLHSFGSAVRSRVLAVPLVVGMIYHIITTPECNLCCVYCGEKAFCEPSAKDAPLFEPVPSKIQYSTRELKEFLLKDKEEVGIIFYGGEPLLEINTIKDIIDALKSESKVKYFMMQTNGTLLNRLPPAYINRFHTILVSIDGDKKTTDANRGEGTYEKVVANLRSIVAQGFKGEIIARMAVEEPANFFEDITFLLGASKKTPNYDFVFSSVHWQLDANMWHDYKKRDFSKWSKRYDEDITKLADYWVGQMKQGKVLRLYPFLGIINSLLFGEKYSLRCGSGVGNFTILPNGKISACPIMSGIKDYYLGDIRKTGPSELPGKLSIGEPCISCKDFELCGGRCLYSNLYPRWPAKGVKELCATVKHLLREMERIAPEVQKLLNEKKVNEKDLKFVKYNCAEIIP